MQKPFREFSRKGFFHTMRYGMCCIVRLLLSVLHELFHLVDQLVK